MRVFAMTCGWLTGPASIFLDGESGTLRVPVPVFLIDHPAGKVLFDSGMHPRTATDAEGRLGPMASVFPVELGAREDVAGRLAELQVDPAEVRYLVCSHLHFDHAGGNELVPNARLVVQRREWEAGHDPDLIMENQFMPQDYDHGHELLMVDGEHDLFGDGRVVCIPTYGHTPGHQSLRLRLDGGETILTADACYLRRTLDEMRLPTALYDREQTLASLRGLRDLRDRGARLVYGHDPDCWANVPQAPQPLE